MIWRLRAKPLFILPLLFCALVASSCVKLSRRTPAASSQNAPQAFRQAGVSASSININTASPGELEKLPGIGKALAARIVAHREKYGRFQRAEHLIMVHGISDRRFREIRPFITIE
ncbi:MAG TPA: helix-hairpin-helix domain-containing protein [Pyrinomonadaceae bacterium]|nr:helix-hairpin-helix domain-containing protein [Pyrinomonadaceae bacterium]